MSELRLSYSPVRVLYAIPIGLASGEGRIDDHLTFLDPVVPPSGGFEARRVVGLGSGWGLSWSMDHGNGTAQFGYYRQDGNVFNTNCVEKGGQLYPGLHTSARQDQLHVSNLTSKRSLISLSGKDTHKLLQGLMTNDIKRLEQADSTSIPDAFYCGFLNPQGRLIAPAFIYPRPSESTTSQSALLDCHAGNKEGLQSFIKRFKLRSKVTITDAQEEFSLWSVWATEPGELEEVASQLAANQQSYSVFRDARTPQMGLRILSSDLSLPALQTAIQANEEEYNQHRIRQGVPDGPDELAENHSLPLEANIDFMGGVDFRKGCYVGQELTARTHHTGVVRKRVMPVRIKSAANASVPPPVGADLRAPPAPGSASKRSKSAGKLLSVVPDREGGYVALASLRLAHVAKQGALLHFTGGDGVEWTLEPVWPEWWPQGVREEFAAGEETASE